MRTCKNTLRAACEKKRWQRHKKGEVPLLYPGGISIPLRSLRYGPDHLRAHELLEGGAIQLLAFHEREGQPVELLAVLAQ